MTLTVTDYLGYLDVTTTTVTVTVDPTVRVSAMVFGAARCGLCVLLCACVLSVCLSVSVCVCESVCVCAVCAVCANVSADSLRSKAPPRSSKAALRYSCPRSWHAALSIWRTPI